LDGVIACSRGEKGWWGPGLRKESVADRGAPEKSGDGTVLNKEGFWSVGSDGQRCFASAPLKSGGEFMLKAEAGQLGFGVGMERPPRQGRRGSFQTEAYAFDFQPSY